LVTSITSDPENTLFERVRSIITSLYTLK